VGDGAFAAVGVSGAVMNLFLFLISGGCSGVSILLSQFHGAKNGPAFRQDFYLAACFGALLTLGLTLLATVLLEPLLILLQTPADIMGYVTHYLRVIFLGFLAAFAYHLCSAVLQSVGSTRAALGFLMISMGVNLALDLTFVAVFRWGVAGAAWATVLAQALAAGLCLVYLRLAHPQLMFHRADMVFDGPLLLRTAHFSLVSSLHMCSLYIGKLLVQGTVNGLGTGAISAYTAATRIEGFANSFGDSGATAVAVFIGQNTGAGDQKRVRNGFFTGERLLALFGVAVSLVMILAAVPCLKLVLPQNSADSFGPALGYLRLVACFYVFNFLGSGLAGYFRGRGLVNIPVIGATGHITIRVILSYFLASRMGLPAVALATGIGWMCVVAFWAVLLLRDQRRLAHPAAPASVSSEEC
jgi:Na+-driven multidrug efflux pump